MALTVRSIDYVTYRHTKSLVNKCQICQHPSMLLDFIIFAKHKFRKFIFLFAEWTHESNTVIVGNGFVKFTSKLCATSAFSSPHAIARDRIVTEINENRCLGFVHSRFVTKARHRSTAAERIRTDNSRSRQRVIDSQNHNAQK